MAEKMEIDHPLNNIWSQLQDPALSRELLTSDFEIFPTQPKQLGIQNTAQINIIHTFTIIFLSLSVRKPNQILETDDTLEEGEIPEEEIDDEVQSDSTHVQEPISTLPGQPIEAKFVNSKNIKDFGLC